MHNIELFRQLVTAQGEQVTTTSRKIAEAFGKHHYNVLKAIDALSAAMNSRPPIFTLAMKSTT